MDSGQFFLLTIMTVNIFKRSSVQSNPAVVIVLLRDYPLPTDHYPLSQSLLLYSDNNDGDLAFRVWQSPNPAANEMSMLVAGQTATNGIGGVSWNTSSTAHVYLQAMAPGTATLVYSFYGTGEAEGIVSRASMKLTAVSVQIKTHGTDITDTTIDVNVGERIVLEAVISPSEFPMTGEWEISGSEAQPYKVVGDYIQNVLSGDVDYIYSSFSTNVAFYWIDSMSNATATYRLIYDDWKTVCKAAASFTVHKPLSMFESMLTSVSPAVGVREDGFGQEHDVYLEFGTIHGDFGIVWTNTVTTWCNGGGELKLVQLINSSLSVIGETHQFEFSTLDYVLDSTDGSNVAYFNAIFPIAGGETKSLQYFTPGVGWGNLSDTPAVRLGGLDSVLAFVTSITTPAALTIKRCDTFKSYLMYRPAGLESIWITLRKMKWNWEGEATRNSTNDQWELVPGSGDSPISAPHGFETFELPIWSSNFHRMIETNTVAIPLAP